MFSMCRGQEPAGAAAAKKVVPWATSVANPELYPMWVISIKDLLELEDLPAHQELMRRGKLVQYEDDKMVAIFASHQWTANAHPDPTRKQFTVLQEALRKLCSGELVVDQFHLSKLLQLKPQESPDPRELRDHGYVWFDWFAVPQVAARSIHQDVGADLQKAVDSIPNYVERCKHFFILAPPLPHQDRAGEVCDYESWTTRGWCRTEMFARVLSASAGPLIKLESTNRAEFTFPNDWVFHVPGEGRFTVETDKKVVAPVIQALMDVKLKTVQAKGDRFQQCLFRAMGPNIIQRGLLEYLPKSSKEEQEEEEERAAEVEDKEKALLLVQRRKTKKAEEFLAACAFTGPEDTSTNSYGWRPLHFAVYHSAEAVELLLKQGAEINALTTKEIPRGDPVPGNVGGPPLWFAATTGPPEVTRVLLQYGAKTEIAEKLGMTPLLGALLWRHNPEPAKMLIEAKADVRAQNIFGADAACLCAGHSTNPEKLRILLDHIYPDTKKPYDLKMRNAICGTTIVHWAAGGDRRECLELLIRRGVDVNHRNDPSRPDFAEAGVAGTLKWKLMRALFYDALKILPIVTGHTGDTALVFTARRGLLGTCKMLLEAKADPTIRNAKGVSALDEAKRLKFTALIELLEEAEKSWGEKEGRKMIAWDGRTTTSEDHHDGAGLQWDRMGARGMGHGMSFDVAAPSSVGAAGEKLAKSKGVHEELPNAEKLLGA